jgi:hypothetical protein
MEPKYSDLEYKMLSHFVENILLDRCEPTQVYRIIIEQCFFSPGIYNSKYIESFRRCARVFLYGNSPYQPIYRMTQEFDKLIELE